MVLDWEWISGHIGGKRVLSPLREPCTQLFFFACRILLQRIKSQANCKQAITNLKGITCAPINQLSPGHIPGI